MQQFRNIYGLLVPAIVLFSGCAPADEDVEMDENIGSYIEPAAGCPYCYEPPTGKNGLIPPEFWSTTAQQSMREIQNAPLGGGGMYTPPSGPAIPRLPNMPFTNTLLSMYPEVIKHLIQCALPEGKSVYSSVTGVIYDGWWGLAPTWLTTNIASNTAAQEWVTGCMVARLNKTGTHVDILLEGDYTPIQTTEPANSAYWYNEAAYFGNMFNSPTTIQPGVPAFKAFVCRESNLVATCPGDGGQNWVDKRICDDAPGICGLVDVGRCFNPTGSCAPNGAEHWKCKKNFFSTYELRTVGVQLLEPLDALDCNRK